MFIDEIKVYARAGHGGKGAVAFHREAFVAKGGPSGGNGGRGGDVILQADHDLNNLIAQFYQPRLIAQTGKAGMGKGMDGPAGKDLLIKVPCGNKMLLTSSASRPILRTSGSARAMEIDLSAEESAPASERHAEKGELIADLTQHGQQFILCKGGR